MYISPKASRIRKREAKRARDNRAEIVKARSLGQITRRDLIRWGIFTLQRVARVQERPEPLGAQRPSPTCPLERRAVRCSVARSSSSASIASTCSTPFRSLKCGSETDAVFGSTLPKSEPWRQVARRGSPPPIGPLPLAPQLGQPTRLARGSKNQGRRAVFSSTLGLPAPPQSPKDRCPIRAFGSGGWSFRS
jgi:hypothetical protein